MEPLEIFKQYEPIMSIYETADEYICIPERKDAEPLAVFYDKSLKQYDTIFFYEDDNNTIVDTITDGTLVYGKQLSFKD